MAENLSEKQIEDAILRKLNKVGYFTIKLKDQAAYRDGSFRKTGTYEIRGVSDLVVFLPEGRCIWLEIKSASGKLSEHQERFKTKISSLQHVYAIARSVNDALEIVSKVMLQ